MRHRREYQCDPMNVVLEEPRCLGLILPPDPDIKQESHLVLDLRIIKAHFKCSKLFAYIILVILLATL